MTRESVSVFLDNQANVLYVVYRTDDGVILGFPVRDAAHQALVTSPPKIRLTLTFPVLRAKQAYKLRMGKAAEVVVAASN